MLSSCYFNKKMVSGVFKLCVLAVVLITVDVLNGNVVATVLDCFVDGQLYKNGETFKQPKVSICFTYKCIDGATTFMDGACDVNGTCYKPGSQFENSCSTYTCSMKKENGGTEFSAILAVAGCKDAKKTCHKTGEVFPSAIEGVQYKKCSCLLEGEKISVTCKN